MTLTEPEFLNLLSCPECGTGLGKDSGEEALFCRSCQESFKRDYGIWRMLTGPQLELYQPFISTYRPLRQGDGWERDSKDYYLNLPFVAKSDSQYQVWRIRRRSLQQLLKIAGEGQGRRALDLGAGNGWLSRQLTLRGFKTVALDLNTDGPDSLEGATLFMEHDNTWIGRVQASMNRLPFKPETFALCVTSGALHYADLRSTLKAAFNTLQPGGHFIITDSPVFTTVEAGEAMVKEQRYRLKQSYGQEPQWPGGKGFLLEPELLDELREAGFATRKISIERVPGKIKRALLKPLRRGRREEALFPVFDSVKPY